MLMQLGQGVPRLQRRHPGDGNVLKQCKLG